ncbi:MAG: nucleotidyl transferase AbiEii/AbiGii toxin family protein [Planctomycetes bacterium]|nr:nucleotidyl transferase AbiEii/AbiGii toxin family protein [Planctomycetota bacterium]
MKLRDSPEDHLALVAGTATALGLPEAFVEKDYWITELLRSVARPIESGYVVFKGGTSLSKGFSLIRRFSEDVDILLVVTRERGRGFGRGAVDGILKRICTRAQEDMGLAGNEAVLESSSRGVHRNVRFRHFSRYEAQALRPGVLLELGVRGGPEPRETREIRSMLAGHAVGSLGEPLSAFDEFAPFPMEVLHPRRTLLEKLALLHHLACSLPESRETLFRAARHLYDIHQLLSDGAILESLGGSCVVASETAGEMAAVSREGGWPYTPRPACGYAASPAFDAGHQSGPILAAGLDGIRGLVIGEVPTIAECRAAVGKAAGLL